MAPKRNSGAQIVLTIITIILLLSMILGFVATALPR